MSKFTKEMVDDNLLLIDKEEAEIKRLADKKETA